MDEAFPIVGRLKPSHAPSPPAQGELDGQNALDRLGDIGRAIQAQAFHRRE
jgi:hypothetical protein